MFKNPCDGESINGIRRAKDPIPVPLTPESFKGNLPYRTTPQRHYQLAVEAQRRKMSINKVLDLAVEKILSHTGANSI